MQVIDISHNTSSAQVFKAVLTSKLYPIEHYVSLSTSFITQDSHSLLELHIQQNLNEIKTSFRMEDSVKTLEVKYSEYKTLRENLSTSFKMEDSKKKLEVIYSQYTLPTERLKTSLSMLDSKKELQLIGTSTSETLYTHFRIEDSKIIK